MREIILTTILGFASCARLDNLYLPPGQTASNRIQLNVPLSRPTLANIGGLSRQSSAGIIKGDLATHSHLSRNQERVPILKFTADNDGDGPYSYSYETGNSISAEEQGDARGGTRARGAFSYTSPEGQQVSLTYTADENGFAPQGSHIPTPPPVPEAILKSLQVIAASGTSSYSHQEQGASVYAQSLAQNAGGLAYSSGISGGTAAGGGYKY